MPDRVPRAEALSQLREARRIEDGPLTLEAVSAPTAILNEQRQVVYANRAFQEFAGAGSVEELCGERPGEILGCINADAGCGDAESCRFCGTAQVILETQRTGQAAVRECHMTVSSTGRGPAHDFLVRSTPFEITNRPFVLVSFTDISHQKRRVALERIFFHDILNTTSCFRVYLDLLKRGTSDKDSLGLISRLRAISETLEEEILGQKVITSAENGTLQVQRDLIDARDLAAQVAAQLEDQEIARGRTLALAPLSDSFTFISDDSLVKRILVNMIKNALEASPEGAEVTIGFCALADGKARFQVHNPGFIEHSIQKQIFHRYFSTKGGDRGLGTWGMRLLSEDYLGGKVSFESTKDRGTTFFLTLPLKPRDL
jgi:nitrogen-specific signal transduction histidine kinase